MCLYGRLILNPKYKPNKKNGGKIPPVYDIRTLYVPIGCGQCMECRKSKAREWQCRMMEDIKENKNGHMITLTLSNESYKKLYYEVMYEELEERLKIAREGGKIEKAMDEYETDNKVATKAMRLFLERWRKKYKKSVRHWMVTELGHNGTENIHLHGIMWTDIDIKEVTRIWGYGFVWDGYNKNGRRINYVNGKTISYIIKYISKIDFKHKEYRGKILTSAGIGANYMRGQMWKKNKYKELETEEYYRTESGHKIALPIYWRNKIYTEDQRQALWVDKLNKGVRWVNGNKIDISRGLNEYGQAVWEARRKNAELGYGNGKVNWNREEYENNKRIKLNEKRINNTKKE